MKFDYYFYLHLFHVFVIAPLLIAIYFYGKKTPDIIFSILLGLGVIILLYHLYKAYIKYNSKSPWIWVNIVHILLVAPLFIWIGSKGKKTEPVYYDMLAFLAMTAFSYNLLKLYKDIKKK
jgi:hypothetical protein